MKSKLVTTLAVALITAEVLLVLISWLLSVTIATGVRSLLTGEGVRWFMGSFTEILLSPLLVWILLLAMAWGVSRRAFASPSSTSGRQRLGLRLSFLFSVLYMAVIMALAMVPHAILSSVSGHLFPSSPFSRALVPIFSFGTIMVATVYGVTTRSFRYVHDIIDSLVSGVSQSASFLFLYILVMQLYETAIYVFG